LDDTLDCVYRIDYPARTVGAADRKSTVSNLPAEVVPSPPSSLGTVAVHVVMAGEAVHRRLAHRSGHLETALAQQLRFHIDARSGLLAVEQRAVP
jgi:hypothetical protein